MAHTMQRSLHTVSWIAFLGAALPSFPALAVPAASTSVSDKYSLGIEGFEAHSKQSKTGVDNDSDFGSVTGSIKHNFGSYYGSVDARFSYGHDDYNTPTEHGSDNTQWDMDGRVLIGKGFNAAFSPYIGLGTRYFIDKGKSTQTNLGLDSQSHTLEFYLPIGATFRYYYEGLTISPTFEYDQLLWGKMNARALPGEPKENIRQEFGYGLRGELMFSQGTGVGGYGWQFGPFIRYWKVNQSKNEYTTGGTPVYQPAYTDMQVGLALRALW